jgi:hypothetical protein
MALFVRQTFDVNTILSPGLAKTIESTSGETDPIVYPTDIFKMDVNGYLNPFGDVIGGTAPLKPLSENASGRLNSGFLATKQGPTLAAAQVELKPSVQAPVASRFGFTKH